MTIKTPTNLITLKEAAEVIGISVVAMHGNGKKNKYESFKVRTPERRVQMFDINAYKEREDLKVSLTEQTKLLVEYLYHIEGMAYTMIAKLSKVGVTMIHQLNFGFDNALKIARAIKYLRRFHFKRYHEYYNYPHKAIA